MGQITWHHPAWRRGTCRAPQRWTCRVREWRAGWSSRRADWSGRASRSVALPESRATVFRSGRMAGSRPQEICSARTDLWLLPAQPIRPRQWSSRRAPLTLGAVDWPAWPSSGTMPSSLRLSSGPGSPPTTCRPVPGPARAPPTQGPVALAVPWLAGPRPPQVGVRRRTPRVPHTWGSRARAACHDPCSTGLPSNLQYYGDCGSRGHTD